MSKPSHTILDFKTRRVLSEQTDSPAFKAEQQRIRELRSRSTMVATRAMPEDQAAHRQTC